MVRGPGDETSAAQGGAMTVRKVLGLIGSLTLAGLSTVALATPVHAANCMTGTSTLTNHPDGGLNGVWATDTLTRVVQICTTAEPAGADWTYQATVTDTGAFSTLAGSTL